MNLAWLVRQWVQAMFRKAVYRAATEQLASSPPPALPCDTALVFALGIESAALTDRLSGRTNIRGDGFRVCQGTLQGRSVAIVRSGVGRAAAERATQAAIDAHRPRRVISTGFAGGLCPQLRRHDILIANRVSMLEGPAWDLDVASLPADLLDREVVHVGPLVTGDRIVRRPADKRALGERSGAWAVDMETAAVIDVCRRNEVPALAIRVISDAVDDELPPDVEKLVGQKTSAARVGAALSALARRPTSVGDMFQLQETAHAASRRLAKFLEKLLQAM